MPPGIRPCPSLPRLFCLLLFCLALGGCAAGLETTAKRQEAQAASLYEQGLACGRSSEAEGQRPDLEKSRRLLEEAAALGHLPARHAVAWLYFEGRGVPQDRKRAAELFEEAARQGYAESQYLLGLIHAQGWGVPQDSVLALRWLQKAAEQGHPQARELLQNLFKNPRPQ